MDEIRIHDRGRGPELVGTRTTVYDVIPYLERGRSPEYIAAAMGHTTEQILALCRYIEEHREEVMEVHRRIEERIRRGNPPEIEERIRNSPNPKVAEIRAKWAEMQRRRAEEA